LVATGATVVVPNSVIYKMLGEAPDKSAEALENRLTSTELWHCG
jgi:hypothetical protein